MKLLHFHMVVVAVVVAFSNLIPDAAANIVVRSSSNILIDRTIYHRDLSSTPTPAKEYANGRIIDISHQIREGLPNYGSNTLFGDYLLYWTPFDSKDVKPKTQCLGVQFPIHISTHVDAPSHVFPEYEIAGYDVDTLDLDTLNGPALVVEVPSDKNITAETLQSLNIPAGTKRVLFKTSNTDRLLMWKPFESNYTGFTADGAQWLVDNTSIKLIGIDYLSIGVGSHAEDYVPPHQILLKPRDIIPVEGLNLLGVKPGAYDIHCLPLRLLGGDGAPTRCILYRS